VGRLFHRARNGADPRGNWLAYLHDIIIGSFVQLMLSNSWPAQRENADPDEVDQLLPIWQKAQLAGLGALANRCERYLLDRCGSTLMKIRAIQSHIAIGVQEVGPQLVLQGTGLMAIGAGLVSQPAVAFSMAITALLGLKRAAELAMAIALAARSATLDDQPHPPGRPPTSSGRLLLFVTVYGVPCCLFIGMLTWGSFRVFAAESCSSRIWGLTTGCVDIPGDMPDVYSIKVGSVTLNGTPAVVVLLLMCGMVLGSLLLPLAFCSGLVACRCSILQNGSIESSSLANQFPSADESSDADRQLLS